MKKHVVLIIIIIAICASIVAYALLSKEKEYEFDWDRFHDDIATIKQQYYASSDVIKDTVNLLLENEEISGITFSTDNYDYSQGRKRWAAAYFFNRQRSGLKEEAPELYDAYMQCPDFIRNNGLSKSTTTEKSIICEVLWRRYSNEADETIFILYFGNIEEEGNSFIIYSEQLDEDCWIVAKTYGYV